MEELWRTVPPRDDVQRLAWELAERLRTRLNAREAEVADAEVAVLVHQQVLRLEVAVDAVHRVQVLEPAQDLPSCADRSVTPGRCAGSPLGGRREARMDLVHEEGNVLERERLRVHHAVQVTLHELHHQEAVSPPADLRGAPRQERRAAGGYGRGSRPPTDGVRMTSSIRSTF